MGSIVIYSGLALAIASPNNPFTSLSWDNGKEVSYIFLYILSQQCRSIQIRIYYLGLGDVLWEHAYSAYKGINGWYHGDIYQLNISLAPTSCVAAVRWEDQIRIYYQGKLTIYLGTNFSSFIFFDRPKIKCDP